MRLTNHSKNILSVYTGDVAGRMLGLLATGYLARILGPSHFGTIAIGLAVLAYAMILGNSGLPVLGTRKVAGETERFGSVAFQIITLRLILSAIAFIIGGCILFFFVSTNDIFYIALVYLTGVFPSAIILDWFYQGRQQLVKIAAGQILGMFFYLVLILALVHTTDDLIRVAYGWVLGLWLNSLLLFIFFKSEKYVKNGGKEKKALRLRPLFLEALPLGVASLIAQFTMYFPPIVLGLVSSRSDVGYFSAAFKLTVFLLIFNRVFYHVFFPNISRCYKQTPERLDEIVNRILKLTATFALSVGLLFLIGSELVIRFVFGSSFLKAVPIFQILIGYFILKMINSVFSFTLIGIEMEKKYSKSLIGGVTGFLLTIAISIRTFGSSGVAFALVIYQLVALAIMAFALVRHMNLRIVRNLIVPILVTCCLFIPFFYLVRIPVFLKLVLGVFIACPMIVFSGGIRFNDLMYLRGKLV